MSMDLFEKVLARTRKPGPVTKRLPKSIGTLKFATMLGWGGAALALASGLFPVELGLVTESEQRLGAFLRSLPLVAVFAGVAVYMRFSLLGRFMQAAKMFPKAEKQEMRMRWTPAMAVLRKVVELYPAPVYDDAAEDSDATEKDNEPDYDNPVARAVVEKNLRRFDLATWVAPVTVYLDLNDPERRVLIDDGRFLYAGSILAKDEPLPSPIKRNGVILLYALFVALLAGIEAWYSSGAEAIF